MNKIHLIGNVVHTPEMRATQSGVNVCKFSVAVNRRFKNPQTGDYDTDFFDVQAWRQLADLCGKFLEKGRKVAVVGSMYARDYEAKDGSKRRTWEVVADEVEFLTPKAERQGGEAQTPKEGTTQMTARQALREAAKNAAKQAAYVPADQGFTEIEDDELPF